MKPLLLASHAGVPAHAPFGRRAEDTEVHFVTAVPAPRSLDPARPTVLLLDRALLRTALARPGSLSVIARHVAIVGVGGPGETDPASDFPVEHLTGFIGDGSSPGAVLAQLQGAFRHADTLVAARRARARARSRSRELSELSRVGVALTNERDLVAVLNVVLTQALRLTTCDAGSIYLVERSGDAPDAPATLRFKAAHNTSLGALELGEFSVPMDRTSLAGYAGETGDALAVEDVYALPDDAAFQQNRSFDERTGYRTKSVLVLPLTTPRGARVGVLQLINRKHAADARLLSAADVDREVVSFDPHAVEVAKALAAQAAVAIENSLLYQNIERLFEGFVTAAVTAVEARDPASRGHAARVARMSVALAGAVAADSSASVPLTRDHEREIRYAGLLHDFGKVGVREHVLVKERKLYAADLEVIRQRFARLALETDLEFERAQVAHLLRHGRDGYDPLVKRLEERRTARREQLARWEDVVRRANEPTVLDADAAEELTRLAAEEYVDGEGEKQPLLTPDEISFLTIRRGCLNEAERREIESHVGHTVSFLREIPWPRELGRVPDIAGAHHERPDGRGYPNSLGGDDIPLESRIIAVADVFDALTSADRPYKKAVSIPKALDILRAEATAGTLDERLVTAFIEARVWEAAADRPADDVR